MFLTNLSGEPNDEFEVVPKSGLNEANLMLRVKNSEDLIRFQGSLLHFKLTAKDNGITGESGWTNVFVQVETINQYPPVFDKEIYEFIINENSEQNTTVGFVSASDLDKLDDYGKVWYELKNGQGRFEIERESGRVFTHGTDLDRELIDAFYMSVEAVDGGGIRTSAQLIIRLNDLNDNPPQFVNTLLNPGEFQFVVGLIEENSAKWLEPVRLQTVDRDLGDNAIVSYEIIAADIFMDYFNIEQRTGALLLRSNRTLDFEEIFRMRQEMKSKMINNLFDDYPMNLGPGEVELNLVVIAKDHGNPSLNSKIIVKIVVKDLNDHKPVFQSKLYNAKVLETAKSGDFYDI